MNVERHRLANGLTVLLEERRQAPVVALQAWVNVGSADEQAAVAGVAHVHEHMLFKGTTRRGVGEIARSVEAAGGEINAWTSFDQTVYHVVLAAADTALGVDVLADALRNSTFDPRELQRELEVVVEEIRRAEDSPNRRISNALFALAYGDHPYGRPVLGTEETVRALTQERVLDFYRAHYRPSSVTLVAVGDFRAKELLARVEEALGDWRDGAAVALPSRPQVDAAPLRARVLREDVKESRVAVAWSIPGLHHRDIVALDALAAILGQGESSRLFVETRRRREVVSDVHAFAYTPRDPGLLLCGGAVRGDNVGAALEAILAQVYRMRDAPVTSDELAKVKVMIASESAYQRETMQGEARRLGYFEVVAGDYQFEQRYRDALAALTVADVRAVAQTYLDRPPTIVVQEPLAGATTVEHIGATVAAASRPPARAAGRAGSSEVERIVLPSGAVLLLRSYEAPVLAVRAVACGGLRWEAARSAGLSNLFASVFGLSTAELGAEAMAQRVAALGGSVSAFSSRNTVGLRGDFIAEKGREGLELFFAALARPTFRADDLERERAVVLERIRTRDDHPGGVAFDAFAERLYPRHPYGLRQIGTETSVKAVHLDDIVAYHQRFLAPGALCIAVAGDIDGALVRDLVLRELVGQAPPQLPAVAPVEPIAAARAFLPLDKKQTHVIVGAQGTTIFDEERYALEVLTTVLSGQSGRLFLDLRDRQSLAYSVSSASLEGLDAGYVMVHMATGPDKVEAALAGLYDHLARLRDTAISAEELGRAQRYLIGTHAIDLQRAGAGAMLGAVGERLGLGHTHHHRYPERIAAVTVERVAAAARRFLATERLIEVVVGPRAPKGA